MTQEGKDLLLKDISARLRFGLVVEATYKDGEGWKTEDRKFRGLYEYGQVYVDAVYTNIENIKPYLRPMDSMTEEESEEASHISRTKDFMHVAGWYKWASVNDEFIDWLNAHHFDYRGLIPMGLALPAKEGMYNG